MAVVLCAGVVSVAPLVGSADAKRKDVNVLRAGKYTGLTETGGSVNFTLTRKGRVNGFTLTPLTLYCTTEPSAVLPVNASHTKTMTFTRPPFRMQGVSKKNPSGKKFEFSDPFSDQAAHEGAQFKGKATPMLIPPRAVGTGMSGEVYYFTTNGPAFAAGTERCISDYIDWEARIPGTPGHVAFSDRPPLDQV